MHAEIHCPRCLAMISARKTPDPAGPIPSVPASAAFAAQAPSPAQAPSVAQAPLPAQALIEAAADADRIPATLATPLQLASTGAQTAMLLGHREPPVVADAPTVNMPIIVELPLTAGIPTGVEPTMVIDSALVLPPTVPADQSFCPSPTPAPAQETLTASDIIEEESDPLPLDPTNPSSDSG